MKQLDRFHQRGCVRLRKTESLTLRNRNRMGIRADGDGDRNSNSIEPRHIAQTGDADLPCLGYNASQRLLRRRLPDVFRA